MVQDVVKAFPAVEGLVVARGGRPASTSTSTEKDGVQAGQEFTVFRKGEAFRHPITGKPLGRYEDILGYAQVARVQPQFSEARLHARCRRQAARRAPRTARASPAAGSGWR